MDEHVYNVFLHMTNCKIYLISYTHIHTFTRVSMDVVYVNRATQALLLSLSVSHSPTCVLWIVFTAPEVMWILGKK